MEIYLVMKSNLKRNFLTKSTYFIILLLPVIISMIGIFANGISSNSIRVGVFTEDNKDYEDFQKRMNGYENIQYEKADGKTIHTDVIMSKYQYVVNYLEGKDTEGILNEIENIGKNGLEKNKSNITLTERIVAMLTMVYMIMATLYATKIIKDKKDGTFQRFIFSGNGKIKYAMGYALSTGTIIFIQIIIAIVIVILVDENIAMSLSKAISVIMAMTFLSTIYGMVMAMINKKDMNANICASSVAVICSLIGGTFVSISEMPYFLQVVSIISPIRWMIELV